jgi:xylulokinase
MDQHVLAIDHGTSGIKAAIVSARGVVVDSDFEATPIQFIEGGGAEQDPEDWWSALLKASRRLIDRHTELVDQIGAVCVSSTFSTTVAVDRNGQHLGNALTWMDSRGAPYVRRVMSGFPSLLGYNLPKAWKWISRTAGAPTVSGKDDAAHVLFWKYAQPEVYARTHVFLGSKDYLNLRLTGKCAASYDSMHLFWVTDARDPNALRYDDELIALLGIDRDKLPPLHASTDVLGPLRAECADAMGVPRGIPVVLGSPDHQCALIGSGAVRDYEPHLYVGTSSWIECIVPWKRTDMLHSIASFPTAIAGKYQCVNEQDLAGGALSFLADNILFHRNAFLEARMPDRPYEVLDRIAETVPAGSHKLLFTPWLNGERTPVDDGTLRGGFHNISTATNLDHMIRAVMEGVAYNTRWSLRYVERFVRRRLSPIRIIGGAAQSDVWCQIFADVLDRELHRVEDPRQANARGAAFIAAVGLGWIRFEDIPRLVRCDKVYRPDPANRRIYDDLFGAFLEIQRCSKRTYRHLNG